MRDMPRGGEVSEVDVLQHLLQLIAGLINMKCRFHSCFIPGCKVWCKFAEFIQSCVDYMINSKIRTADSKGLKVGHITKLPVTINCYMNISNSKQRERDVEW